MLLTVQDMLAKIGIKVGSIDKFDLNVFYSSLSSGGPYATGADDLYLLHWSTGTQTIDQYQLYACDEIPTDQKPNGLNGSHICNPEIDRLWKVLGTSMSADERQNAANQIQTIIADQVQTIYMAKRQNPVVLNKNITGFAFGGYAGIPWISLADMKRTQ